MSGSLLHRAVLFLVSISSFGLQSYLVGTVSNRNYVNLCRRYSLFEALSTTQGGIQTIRQTA